MANTPVQNPYALPGRYGLVVSSALVTEANRRWINGVVFEQDGCPSGFDAIASQECDDPDEMDIDSIEECEDQIESTSFVVWEGVRRSTFDHEFDIQGKAQRKLERSTSRQIEQEFWNGTLAQAKGWPNFYLEKAGATDLGSFGFVYALAELQQAGAECSDGGRLMIHASPRLVSLWDTAQAIRKEGNLFLDVFDNIIVPGVGYDSPAEATEPAYATDMVYLRMDEVQFLADVEHKANARRQWAFRHVNYTLDNCCHIKVTADIENLCG